MSNEQLGDFLSKKVKPNEIVIGRTFVDIPRPEDFGHYELGQIAAEELGIDQQGEWADFGSNGRLEWGYGKYGIVFAVPEKYVYKTSTPNYEIEKAFVSERARILFIAVRDNDNEIDVEGIKKMLLDNDIDVPIFRVKSRQTPYGESTVFQR